MLINNRVSTTGMKKLLIISTYAPPAIGGPQNMYNLLRDETPHSYSILTSFYNIDNVSAKTGTWLNGEYFFYDKPSAKKEDLSNLNNVEDIVGKRSFFSKLKHSMKRSSIIRNLAGPFVIIGQIFLIVRRGRKIIKDTNPDMVLGFSDYGPALIGTFFLHRITKKPFSIFLFDIYKGNFFPFPGGVLSYIFEPMIFRATKNIIVTNDGTKEFYEKKYSEEISKKITIIYNAAFAEPVISFHAPYSPKPPYTILYTGRIYWPQIRSLKNLVSAINEINDIDIRLKIYCPNPSQYVKSLGILGDKVIFEGVAPPQEMPKIQSQADILFLPLSWGTKSLEIINTATPGKMTDYLIAGKPILIHAPEATFLAKYAKKYGFAEVVDKEDIELLKNGIRKILLDTAHAQKLIENAYNIFTQNHEARKNALIFHSMFFN